MKTVQNLALLALALGVSAEPLSNHEARAVQGDASYTDGGETYMTMATTDATTAAAATTTDAATTDWAATTADAATAASATPTAVDSDGAYPTTASSSSSYAAAATESASAADADSEDEPDFCSTTFATAVITAAGSDATGSAPYPTTAAGNGTNAKGAAPVQAGSSKLGAVTAMIGVVGFSVAVLI